MPDSTLLKSWKDIAGRLSVSVRTAQRWERELALPVYRPGGGDKAPVLAYAAELEEWLKVGRNGRTAGQATAEFGDMRKRIETLVNLTGRLRRNSATLNQKIKAGLKLQESLAEHHRRFKQLHGQRLNGHRPKGHDAKAKAATASSSA